MVKEAEVVHIHLDEYSQVTRLPNPLQLKNYAVGLTQINGTINSDTWNGQGMYGMYLCSDVCEPCLGATAKSSFVAPILAPIAKGKGIFVKDITNVIWLKTSRDEIESITLYLTDEKNAKLSKADCHLTCTLVFIPLS